MIGQTTIRHPAAWLLSVMCCLAGHDAWAAADLSLRITADRLSVQPGASGADLVNLTVTLRNDGPDLAPPLVTVALPQGLRIPFGLSATADQGIYDPATGQWLVGVLPSKETVLLAIPAEATSAAADCLAITGSAAIVDGSSITDPDDSNNEARLLIGAPVCAELVVISRRDDRVGASCADALQIIRVENRGPQAATDVSLDITRYEVVSPDNFSEASCTTGSVAVPGPEVVEFGSIASGASREYTTGLRDLRTSGPDIEVAYSLEASAAEPDSDVGDNRLSGRYIIRRPFGDDDDDDSDFVCIFSGALGGTGMERYLPQLRKFRDRFLMTHRAGRVLVREYYRLSPPLARRMAEHEGLRRAVRVALAPVVYAICYPGVSSLLLGCALLGATALRNQPRRQRAERHARHQDGGERVDFRAHA
jgi:hypothetical protein